MSETQKRRDSEQNTIDLIPLIRALWKRAWIIVLVAVAFGAAAFFGTKVLVTPTYRASFTAYVNNRNGVENTTSLSSSDLNAAKSLVYTYAEIITSRSVLEASASQAGLDISYSKLSQMASTDIDTDSAIITVHVVGENPKQATDLASAIAEVAPTFVSQIVEGSSMRVVDTPVQPTGIYLPSYSRNAMLGVVLGIVLTCALVIIAELLNDKVRDADDLERRYGITIIGTIPNVVSVKKNASQYGYSYAQKGGKRK